ncbi:uncharacterized protein [Venturia canescens]|uniref:uncharacterized protein n=1 Tax=Venturia canescens TaxID=32260 RepID=UPI001C9C6818|nr:uncharacterized protein LOC122405935 [Venturia canescens]
MDFTKKCAFLLLLGLTVTSAWSLDEANFFDKGYRSLYRIYEDCQLRSGGVAPCLKKKAINFFDRLGRIENLSIADNLELVRVPGEAYNENANNGRSLERDLEVAMARNAGASRDDLLNDMLLDRLANLMNAFNVQIRMPKTSPVELKRSIEEGRGKMKKMMGMMMMGMAMKMAALVPIAMGVLFLLAGKALIISKIALVLSLIIGLKKLLSQKQGGDSHHSGWQQSGGGGGWDRSLKEASGLNPLEHEKTDSSLEYAQNLAYGSHRTNEK